MRLGHAILALCFTATCASTPPPEPAQAPHAAPVTPTRAKKSVAVRVTPLANGEWRVDYQLPEPTDTVAFVRPSFEHRLSDWSVIEPSGAKLVRQADGDVVKAASAITSFSLRISNPTKQVEKDYELVFPFTDGGTLIYTGHFDLAIGQSLFTFVPRAGERVIVPTGTFDNAVEWAALDETTYVYFGKLQPEVGAQYTLAIDPGFPGWLRAQLLMQLPRIIDYYTTQLQAPLPWKPRLFLSYAEDPREGSMSAGGNTQTGLVQMEIKLGKNFRQQNDPEVLKSATMLLAHELGHLWNSHLYENAGSDWLHEGGAESFALRATRAAGLMTQAWYERELSQAVSKCELGLDDKPLVESSVPGRFKNYYNCGVTISLWVETLLHTMNADADAFTLWRAVFATSKDKKYDAATFGAALQSLNLPAAVSADITSFATGALVPGWLAAHLKQAGLGVSEVTDTTQLPRDYREVIRDRMLKLLARALCGDDTSAVKTDRQKGITFDTARCKALGGASATAINGVSVSTMPLDVVALYDSIAASCAKRSAIDVQTASGTTATSCGGSVRARPPYLQISNAVAPHAMTPSPR